MVGAVAAAEEREEEEETEGKVAGERNVLADMLAENDEEEEEYIEPGPGDVSPLSSEEHPQRQVGKRRRRV